MILDILPFLVLLAPALCQNSTNASNIQEICTTEFAATKPAQVTTTTLVSTTTLVDTKKITSTPSVFINAIASTIQETTVTISTATDTLAQITDTYSSTSTIFDTFTISSTVVTTVSETVTTTILQSPSTISIAASAGFTPIGVVDFGAAKKMKREEESDQCFCIAEGSGSDSGAGAAFSGAGESTSTYKSTLGSDSSPEQTSTITVTSFYPITFPAETSTSYTSMTKPTFTASNSSIASYTITNGSIVASPTQYPSKVYCSDLVQITSTSTLTYSANSTITNYITPPVSTSTFTSTYITTSTFLPVDASVTVTIFSTSTVSSTTIISSTTTQTFTLTLTQVSGATPTVYNACGADNIISKINGNPIVEVDLTHGLLASQSANNAYDCCVACQTAAGCGGSAYVSGSCYLLSDAGACNGSVASYGFATASSGSSITISNGPCGQGDYNGAS